MHGAPTPCGLAETPHTHFGLLDKFSKHRRYNSPICHHLAMDAETLDLAKAIGNCCTSIGVEIAQDGPRAGDALLRAANPCNRRLCPFCEWRRSRAWRRRFFMGLPEFHKDFPTHRALFLTLTVRNCTLTQLRETIQEMHRGWKRMQERSIWPTPHWFRRTEVTFSGEELHFNNGAKFHPHIHAVLFVPAGYFSHGYVKQTEWQKQWMTAMRLDYPPVVDIRRAKTRLSPGGATTKESQMASLEATKYATKATDLIAMGSALGEFNRQVKGLRLSAASTSLKPYVSDKEVTSEELLDTSSTATLDPVRGKAAWFEDVQEYLFTSVI